MGLYLENGYVNIPWILSLGLPYNFIVGGRGTGKTYTSLEVAKNNAENGSKFILLRRQQNQTDTILTPEFSPFKKLNMNNDWNVQPAKVNKNTGGFYNCEVKDDKNVPCGEPLGYALALSTIANIRGFSADDVDLMVYDEFIPEKHERSIKNEGDAFMNAYETINRNRELDGKKPLQVLCLANANNLSNPIFVRMGLVEKAYKMIKTHNEILIDKDRGYSLFMLLDSKISERKKDTALYKMGDESFAKMAIENVFEYDDYLIRNRNLKEYIPLVTIGEISIYEHKTRCEYYVTSHTMNNCPKYGTSDIELKRMFEKYSYLASEYMLLHIYFEQVVNEVLFKKYFKFDKNC